MKERIRKRKAKQYAAAFIDEVKQKLPRFESCTVPAIICHRYYARAIGDTGETFIAAGRTTEDGTRIDLYGIARQQPDILKMVIRHEIIHALLAQKGYPNGDDSDIFLLMATLFYALPYGKFFNAWDSEVTQAEKLQAAGL